MGMHLRGMQSDLRHHMEDRWAVGRQWMISNRLPSTLVLYKQSQAGHRTEVCEIQARSELTLPPGTFEEGDFLIAYRRYEDLFYPFMEPQILKMRSRHIILGDIGFTQGEGRGIVMASNWDMRGVWLHNHLSVPLNVYYKGNLVVQLHANAGLSYMGGGANVVYFNNSGQGLNRDDVLSFRYATSDGHDKFLRDAVLSNVQAMNIHIGIITAVPWRPDPFNGVYNVDGPTHSGISFFHPVAQGTSLVQGVEYYLDI
jgi:hypothetical protein